MSLQEVPKIPDRPLRRKKGANDAEKSAKISDSPTRASESETSERSEEIISEPPSLPSTRPKKSRTTPVLPLSTAPSVGQISRSKTQGDFPKATSPNIPLTRPNRVSTDEKLDDILQSTDQQLKEMRELINKHDDIREKQAVGESKPQSFLESDKCHAEEEATLEGDYIEGDGNSALSENFKQTNSEIKNSDNEEMSEKTEVLANPIERSPSKIEYDIDLSTSNSEIYGKASPEIMVKESENTKSSAASTLHSKESSQEEDIPSIPVRPARPVKLLGTHGRHTGDTNSDSSDKSSEKSNLSNIDSPSEEELKRKRSGPPVPKKPSSRIAAFQEMLQKQQLEQIQGSVARDDLAISKELQHTDASENPDLRDGKGSQREDRNKFTQNLNGIFASPLAPHGPLSTSLVKKVGKTEPAGAETGSKEKRLGDIRHGRARGPRGRKLPTKLSNVEKISSQSNGNEIEIFNTWSIVYTSERESRMKPQDITSSRREVPHYLADSIEGLINAGIQERRPSLSEVQATELHAPTSDSDPFINSADQLQEDSTDRLNERDTEDNGTSNGLEKSADNNQKEASSFGEPTELLDNEDKVEF